MPTAVPKWVLIRSILNSASSDSIQTFFSVSSSTNLQSRLNSFTKLELERFILSLTNGNDILQNLEERYPIDNARTFFLVKRRLNINIVELLHQVNELVQTEMDDIKDLYESRRQNIGRIYLSGQATFWDEWKLLEIPIFYEERIEYRESDKDSQDYGETKVVYDLRKALIWLMEDHTHGIINCSGTTTADAIVKYGRWRLDLNWLIPTMTENMFISLTEEGESRTATFKGHTAFPQNVPTITASARGLSDTPEYKELTENEEREQTSGFFINKSGSMIMSFGVSRTNARVWTPYKLSRPMLIAGVTDIIDKTEQELRKEHRDSTDLAAYITYFRQADVVVDDRTIRGEKRDIFDQLIEKILLAHRQDTSEVSIDPSLLFSLIKHKNLFGFQIGARLDCSNCGGGLGYCQECDLPYEAYIEDENLFLRCPSQHEIIKTDYTCDCGTENEISNIESHIHLYPEIKLLEAISDLFQLMDEVKWERVFAIRGTTLKILTPKKQSSANKLPARMRLDDLRNWRQIARHHLRPTQADEAYVKILKHTKEKCRRNDTPPTNELCKNCLQTRFSLEQVRTEGQMCSPRLMGFVINQGFDGIHHGHEIADVKYEDVFEETNQLIRLGIHLKSWNRPRARGLGRSVYKIKALYTQVFYSAYESLLGQADFDAIGIAIPNDIKKDVLDSFEVLLQELGFSFIVIDRTDWAKIIDAVVEQLSFTEERRN